MTEYIKSRTFFESKKSSHKTETHPIIVCWKLNTPNNLGNVLRLADNMACEKVLFVDESHSFRNRNIKKTAQTSYFLTVFNLILGTEMIFVDFRGRRDTWTERGARLGPAGVPGVRRAGSKQFQNSFSEWGTVLYTHVFVFLVSSLENWYT